MRAVLQSKTFHTFLGIFVSVALLAWVVQAVDIKVVGQQLLAANLLPMLVALPVFFFHYILRALRWRYLLREGESASLRHLFDAIMVGALANFLLPLRAGEFIRPFMLSKQEQEISFQSGFVSVVTERFFDLSAVLLTFSLVVSSQKGLPEWVQKGAYALAILALALFLYILFASLFPKTITDISRRIFRCFPEKISEVLLGVLEDLIESTRVLARPKNLFFVVMLTTCIWLSCYFLFYVFLYLLPIPHTFLLAVSTAVIIALAVAAPSAPGFIGVYQTACFAAFALYGINEEYAITYSVLTHVFQYVVFAAYGFYALWRSGLSLSELRSRSEAKLTS